MRNMTMLALGLLAICPLFFLTSCKTAGSKPDTVTVTKLVDAPRRQYVEIPPGLLAHPAIPPLPDPAYLGADCPRGCYTNAQLRSAIDVLQAVIGKVFDQLDQIGVLSHQAVSTNKAPEDGNPH